MYNQSAHNQIPYNLTDLPEQYAQIFRRTQAYQDTTPNQMPMNAPYDEIVDTAGCYGEAATSARITCEFAGKLSAAGVAVTGLRMSRTQFVGIIAAGVGEATINAGKSITFSATAMGVGGVVINNESFNIFIMEFAGTLAPGERITLNTERFTLKKNNVDILPQFVGDFVDLKTGINEVSIESDTGTRTLLIRVEHRDRWV